MKMNEIRNLSEEELSKQFHDLKKELEDMKLKNRISPSRESDEDSKYKKNSRKAYYGNV